MYLEKLCVFFERPPYCLREMKQIIIVQHVQTPDPDMHACFVAWNWKKRKEEKRHEQNREINYWLGYLVNIVQNNLFAVLPQ